MHIMCCKYINYILQKHNLNVAETKFIRCKDKVYMLQKQNVCCKDNIYMLQRQKLHDNKDKNMCYRGKYYMLQRQNLYVAKTKFICCRDKKLGARCERSRRGFFSPKKTPSYFLKTHSSCFCLISTQNSLKSIVLGVSAPAGAFLPPKETLLFFEKTI